MQIDAASRAPERSSPPARDAGDYGVGGRGFPFLALGCGLAAANIYYTQPLIEPIREALELSPAMSGLIATAPQIGYAAGLVLLLPLCDLQENRRLATTLFCLCSLAALTAAFGEPRSFLPAAFALGAGSVVVQVLLLIAVHSGPVKERGRILGAVTSALLLGVMLSRTFAGLIAETFGWKAVFYLSAAVMLTLAIATSRALPRRRPDAGPGYGGLVISMGSLLVTDAVLRRRSFHHASAFAAFSSFWTTVPLHLADRFHLSQAGVAAFSLTGAASVFAAFLSGRIPDRAIRGPATVVALAAVAAGLGIAGTHLPGMPGGPATLAIASFVLCVGLTVHAVLAQRDILSAGHGAHGRINGAFMAVYFTGGAIGSAIGTWAYAVGGWSMSTLIGGLLVGPALLHAAWHWHAATR